ncbi:alpha/beta hydrolase fold-3 domain-containing protein [Xylariales sp. PMI_506]|nr:alpha/beta hydrolase fold-3 domain-containing protein [Xylariales sp. PMI_506]
MASYETRDEVAALGQVDPEYAELLAAAAGKPMLPPTFEGMHKLYGDVPLPELPDTEHDYFVRIPMRDGFTSVARVHKPKKDGPAPLVVLVHGGGFCIGNSLSMEAMARALAAAYGVVVVCLTYRLAPQHKFPTAVHDVWDGLQWAVSPQGAEALGGSANPSLGFIFGGTSAGANIVGALAQKWVSEAQEPKLTGVWLNMPWFLERENLPEEYSELWFSREQNAESLVISTNDLAWIREAYQPDVRSPEWSPFFAEGAHTGLPPVYIQVCGQDPLRDDGLIYEKVLRKHGVSTRLDVYPGVPHGHTLIFPSLSKAKQSKLDAVKGVGWLLGRQVMDDESAAALEAAAAAIVAM